MVLAEALGQSFNDARERQERIERAARALWDLLQETPRHTRDSAPLRERVRALGVALGEVG